MNLFATSQCPVQSAKDHCNVHNVKMILEVAQMLSTAHFVLDGVQVGYKPTHQNHPCSIFVRSTSENYKWTYEHLQALLSEYTFRTGKTHKSSELLISLAKQPSKIEIGERTSFAMAMPDDFKKLGIFDQTKAYQSYLCAKFVEWQQREKPIKVCWGLRGDPDWYTV
ncbi:pyrimidine dimer DNA glycosylase [Pseudomonas phage vB_PsaM_M1]|nr:pyrimidine dimer DNA glycosylase [Pseudomonas phage vB_PsaM_M1]